MLYYVSERKKNPDPINCQNSWHILWRQNYIRNNDNVLMFHDERLLPAAWQQEKTLFEQAKTPQIPKKHQKYSRTLYKSFTNFCTLGLWLSLTFISGRPNKKKTHILFHSIGKCRLRNSHIHVNFNLYKFGLTEALLSKSLIT